MAIVRPFRGLRPKPELASQVASPPYDVLSSDEAREMAASNPNSFLRVNKAEIDFDPGVDPYGDEVYQRGKDNLQRLQDDGVMVRDDKPCLYLYRLTWQGLSQTGLVTTTSVEEYDQGLIKKHEHTRPAKVKDRANHIQFLNAQVGPVFSTYRFSQDVADVFGKITATKPDVDFIADDQVRHELWVVSDDSAIQAIVDAFANVPCLYIADGHHRSQSASEVCRRMKEANPNHTGKEPYNFFLNVLFADQELRILPYNRVVFDIGSLAPKDFIEKIGGAFDIADGFDDVVPEKAHEYGLYAEGTWFRLRAKDGSFDPNDPVGSIDAAILQSNAIGPVLGIENPKTDDRIDFVGGIRGNKELKKLVDTGKAKLAFSLYPTSIAQLLSVADSGEVMPPKSTWFEPKLRSGMVVNLLSD